MGIKDITYLLNKSGKKNVLVSKYDILKSEQNRSA